MNISYVYIYRVPYLNSTILAPIPTLPMLILIPEVLIFLFLFQKIHPIPLQPASESSPSPSWVLKSLHEAFLCHSHPHSLQIILKPCN